MLDHRAHSDDLIGANAVATFWTFQEKEVGQARLRQTEANGEGKMAFGLAAFQVFGLLFRPGTNDEGVLTCLGRECYGDLHDRGLIDCSASSIGDVSWVPKNAANPSDGCYFCSDNKPRQWICDDFRKLKVNPARDSLKTAAGCANFREWAVEASNDGKNWGKLSNGRNQRAAAVNQRFSVSGSGFVRMIRLRQTGPNYMGEHQFGISYFDVFGPTIYEVAAVGTPKPLHLEQIQALVPALGADEFANVVQTRFPDLGTLQVYELIQKSFP